MKQNLLLYAGVLGCWLLVVPVLAQTGNLTRSRLDVGRKNPTPTTRVINLRNFPFLKHPTAFGLDRTVTIRPNAPVNEYYRSLLLTPALSSPVRAAVRPAVVAETTTNSLAESRLMAEESAKGEERMFANDRIVVSNIYPNPAHDQAEVDYQFLTPGGEAKLVLLSVLGSPVAEYALDRNDRSVRINTRDMPTGYYFYQLALDGRKVATKKLLVRHQ
jgi:hypothetical protein